MRARLAWGVAVAAELLTVLGAAFLGAVGCGALRAQSAAPAARRPNLIVVLADDLGFECLGCNGGSSYRTPNLDRLAASGARFTNAHVQPLCTPTRVQLLTGRYNVRNYVAFGELRRGEVTFGNLLRDAGYATAIAGKWQLGRVAELPRLCGFDEHLLWQHLRLAPRYANPGLELQGVEADYDGGEYGPDVVNAFALDFVSRHRDEPFLLFYPMILPHFPHQATPRSADWDPRQRGEQQGRDVAHFADMVHYMDELVGRLLERLDQLGLRDDTLVLFVGDNGTDRNVRSRFEGREVRGGKGTTTVLGTHVPLIVSWPGRVAAAVVTDLVDSTDVLPTVCAAAGVAVPEDLVLDGVSCWPRLVGQQGPRREWSYCWYSPRMEPLRQFAFDGRFKLYATGELFDTEGDEAEQRPLPDGEHGEVRVRLGAVLARYRDARPAELPEPRAR